MLLCLCFKINKILNDTKKLMFIINCACVSKILSFYIQKLLKFQDFLKFKVILIKNI